MPRIHGFERPFDSYQIASWIAFSLFLASFAVLYAPLHTEAAGIVVDCLYGLLAVATFVFAQQTMSTDPSDACVVAKRRAETLCCPVPPPPPEASNYCCKFIKKPFLEPKASLHCNTHSASTFCETVRRAAQTCVSPAYTSAPSTAANATSASTRLTTTARGSTRVSGQSTTATSSGCFAQPSL